AGIKLAIANAQLGQAQTELATLSAAGHHQDELARLQAEWQSEFDLQLYLTAQMQVTSTDSNYLRDVHDRLIASQPKDARSTRCEAILAIDRWLASGAEQATPTQGKPTTGQSALARFTKWPRLAAVLAVPPQPASVLRVA